MCALNEPRPTSVDPKEVTFIANIPQRRLKPPLIAVEPGEKYTTVRIAPRHLRGIIIPPEVPEQLRTRLVDKAREKNIPVYAKREDNDYVRVWPPVD